MPRPSGALDPRTLVGQDRVVARVQQLVDAWRGFALGRAAEPYPAPPPRYQPVADGEQAASETTLRLLHHWFRREPHTLGRPPRTSAFKYWPHQRRLVETLVYLYEVRGIRRTEELYRLAGVDALVPQRDPWAKLGGQLATGSGKTKMMSLLVAWAYLNARCEPGSRLGFGRHALLIAPGLFVRDRLLADFCPPHGGTPVFWADPVIPPELESGWDLKVYSPQTCPLRLDPAEGALVVTNYHQLLRVRDEPEPAGRSRARQQIELLFEGSEPERLEAVQTPLLERFARSEGLLVLNDEAHHVGDEPEHARFEQKAKDRARVAEAEDEATAMAWIRSLRRLNGSDARPGRLALQVDLSATLYEETGATRKAVTGSEGKGGTQFRPADLFLHTAVRYDLADALKDGIVKKPILERLEVRNQKTGLPEPLIRRGAPNAWEVYRNLLVTGIERWKRVRAQLADEGDPRKPILFILCDNQHEAKEVANQLKYGEAVREDLSHRPITGWTDPETGQPLFVEVGEDGVPRSTVVEIHIGKKEETHEDEWDRIRQAVNAVDRDEIPDPSGRLDEDGTPAMVPNPYNVVVSVMMLKEGWDVRNVKVIVPLRPCDSRTLTEQTLGRGLRKMHPPVLDDEGAAELRTEELYVIEHPSFKTVLDGIRDLVEERDSAEIEHAREYVPILQKADLREREAHGVRLVRFAGLVEVVPDWRQAFCVRDLAPLSPRLPWLEEIADTEIQTFLKAALARAEQEGLTFTLPETPSYRDFDHVIEAAYALKLLRDLRTGYQHKNAVKGVVKEFLELKTFALPMGLPLSFDKVIEGGHGRIALGNLARPEVMDAVCQALQPELHRAITAERRASAAQLSERNATELASYQALKKNVLESTRKSSFDKAAVANDDELRVAVLLDRAKDVTGWLYNDRSGVGYSLEYEWHGATARYYPDFIARARLGEVFHNFIIEVKGRYDDRDKEKARRGRRYCELLTDHDREPWHFLLLLENEPSGRKDITWWQEQSAQEIDSLLRRHEGLPLLPDESPLLVRRPPLEVVPSVARHEQYRTAVPVLDFGFAGLDAAAAEPGGWARVQAQRPLDRRMFVAKVSGRAMEPGVPDGSWGLFRALVAGDAPAPNSLDGRRLLVRLAGGADAEHGGANTLRRWRVGRVAANYQDGEVWLCPDNSTFQAQRVPASRDGVRPLAELLEIVG